MTAARGLQWAGLAGIAAIALARSVIVFAPDVVFDIDPAIDPTPLGAASPVGSLALDVLLLLASAAALAGVALDGRRLRWWMVVLVLVPAVPVVVHGAVDHGDLWRGSTWLAAMVAGLAVGLLAADRALRIVMLAVLLAGLAPLAMRGAMQVSIEHRRTVEQFETHKEAFFRDRGWEPDSAAARIYERRLRQPQPRGWFTTTNLLASLFACGAVVMAGVAYAAARRRLPGGWIGLAVLSLFVLAAGLLSSGSKGAILAAAGGVGLLVVRPFVGPRWGPALCVGLVVATALGVVVRGALLPEDFAGEKSLLFRWHYQIAAARVVAGAPLIGVGPDGFQQAYVAARVPRNPEEVMSAHSMPWDWLSTLGLPGAAWLAVTVVWLWRAARAPRADAGDDEDAVEWPALRVAAAALLIAAPLALWIEFPTLDDAGLTARILGCAGFILLAPLLARLLGAIDGPALAWAGAAGAAVLVAHAQIEMTFFEPGAVVWAACFVAAASRGGDDVARRERPARLALVVPALLVAGALMLAVGPLRTAAAQQWLVREAAMALDPFPADPAGQAAQREVTIARLLEAYEAHPTNPRPLEAAVEQMMLRAPLLGRQAGADQLERALEHAREAFDAHGRISALSLAVQAAARRRDWETAATLARRRTELDPNGLLAWRQLGDVLWEAGAREEAANAYERTLEIDRDYELDQLKRLPEGETVRITGRLDEVSR